MQPLMALVALACAALVEQAGHRVPVGEHGLGSAAIVVNPVGVMVASASVMTGMGPW